MTVRAQEPQVLQPVVLRVSVDVIQVKGNSSCDRMALTPPTLRTLLSVASDQEVPGATSSLRVTILQRTQCIEVPASAHARTGTVDPGMELHLVGTHPTRWPRDPCSWQCSSSKAMERATGLEPARSVWKTEMLAVKHHARKRVTNRSDRRTFVPGPPALLVTLLPGASPEDRTPTYWASTSCAASCAKEARVRGRMALHDRGDIRLNVPADHVLAAKPLLPHR